MTYLIKSTVGMVREAAMVGTSTQPPMFPWIRGLFGCLTRLKLGGGLPQLIWIDVQVHRY